MLLCFALLCIALICFALLRFALLCIALHCFNLLCFALHCFALLRFALLCFALLCFALMLHMVFGTPSCSPARIDPQDFLANDLSQQVKYWPCRYDSRTRNHKLYSTVEGSGVFGTPS